MRRTPGWVRAVSAIITVAGLMTAGLPHRRTVWPATAVLDPSLTPATAVLDPFLTPAYAVAEIRDSGRAAFCRIEADRWRPGQPDSARLLAAAVPATANHDGQVVTTVDDGSRPLEPGRWRLTADVLVDRLAVCEAKGFTGAVIAVGGGFGPVETSTSDVGAGGGDARGTARAPKQLVRTLVAEGNRRGLVVVLVRRAPADR